MEIDRLIKNVFEKDVEANRAALPPPPRYAEREREQAGTAKGRGGALLNLGLAACFALVVCLSVALKDTALKSPFADRGVYIARLLPEDPGEAFYQFIRGINSSFEE